MRPKVILSMTIRMRIQPLPSLRHTDAQNQAQALERIKRPERNARAKNLRPHIMLINRIAAVRKEGILNAQIARYLAHGQG